MAKELMTPLYRQPPGWEINVQTIQELPDRKCFVKNKAEGGIILIETPQVFSPWQVSAEAPGEFNGITPETFKKSVKETQIGEAYLTDREIIEKEYQKRYEELTASEEPKSFREPKK